jgi:hypothetical protein
MQPGCFSGPFRSDLDGLAMPIRGRTGRVNERNMMVPFNGITQAYTKKEHFDE